MNNVKIIVSLLLFCLIPNTWASTNLTTTQKATATLAASCQISAQNLNFGEITPPNGTTPVWTNSGNGSISVLCTKNSAYTIANNLGANNGGQIKFNLLGQTSGDKIQYAICRSNSFTQAPQCTLDWYNGFTQVGTGSGDIQVYTTYGIIKTGYYRPDTYTDTITTTVSF